MRTVRRILGVFFSMLLLVSVVGCEKSPESEQPKQLQLAAEKEWTTLSTYNETALAAWLQPIWYTREVYDETVVFIGEESSANLLYEPSGSVTVRDYRLGVTYVEGRDYTIDGKTITRVSDGQLPYFAVDDYFLVNPGSISIGVNASRCEFDFNENRYLYYGEGTSLTKNHLCVSYRTDELWTASMPKGQTDRTANFLNRVKSEKTGPIMYYGDSITVGCNASGTTYGGNINPYLPSWPNLVAAWLEKAYDVKITVLNKAVGGWQVSNGLANFNQDVLPSAETIDLLVLAFGMNDSFTSTDNYFNMTEEMVARYLEANPSGTVLLVSPMNPNTQSTWVGNQTIFENELNTIASTRDSVAVAPVNTVFTAFEDRGKRTRDWLANNINHPNDFGVRTYAQVILKTLAGNDFFEEIYA